MLDKASFRTQKWLLHSTAALLQSVNQRVTYWIGSYCTEQLFVTPQKTVWYRVNVA